jgi:hypothetical protein
VYAFVGRGALQISCGQHRRRSFRSGGGFFAG